jgi:long-chain acyl-CoA synthetase
MKPTDSDSGGWHSGEWQFGDAVAPGTAAQNGAASTDGHSVLNGHGLPSLDLLKAFAGRRFVVVGGTGFLGKVFWAMLLDRFPEVGHLYLLVRPKAGLGAEARFWKEIASSEMMRPLRERYGADYEAFLRQRVTPIAGDIAQLYCGLNPQLREELKGSIAAVINAAGVVEFDPPLDLALEVNAFGVQNLVSLARDLGDCPVFHTSTCFVAGSRTGFVEEQNPLDYPFPRADSLERSHWDADREISECLDVIRQAKQRADDAFRQSHFVDVAKRQLEEKGAPGYGESLDNEVAKVRRKYVEERLAEMGKERALFWGWPNTYTYTKSLGEQIVASSGLPFTIGRPAIIESTVSFPFAGWNEGINTSAPLIYALRSGQPQLPGSDHNLDIIPCDMVAGGMLMSIAELIEGTAPAVYHYGSSDTNPVTMARIFELTGLYKRHYYQKNQSSGKLLSFIQAHYEGSLLSSARFNQAGPKALANATHKLAEVTDGLARGPVRSLLSPVARGLASFSKKQSKIADILACFAPFTADFDYTFRCDHTRAAYARLGAEDRRRVLWAPESLDWRQWFLEVHVPALETWVFPELEQKLKKKLVAPGRHETLVSLLDEMAARMERGVGLGLAAEDGMHRVSYREWQTRARAVSDRLQALGVAPGDRVALAAQNHPDWAIAFFGIQYAGATAVPLDANVELAACQVLLRASRARVLMADAKVRDRLESELAREVVFADLAGGSASAQVLAQAGLASGAAESPLPAERAATAAPAASNGAGQHASAPVLPDAAERARRPVPQDVAVLIYTSGTTDTPKGVMLSHYNLTSLVASLAPLFPLEHDDRLLSVLPLHHTFELTCGLLLPLSRGARVVYLDSVNRERMTQTLREANITAMVGVPALWESLERQIHARIEERGPIAGKAFEFALSVSRALGDRLGLDAGRLLFGPVHASLGGQLRLLVSGGAALPASTHKLFAGLGLHLAEGYGLTEASPVVSVARAGAGSKPGHVGQAVPGVEIRIDTPDAEGVGEVLVRGPNVMLGYSDNVAETAAVLGADGWLRTGDLGRLDRKQQLSIVGRQKDVIVPTNGENVYPDDVEAKLGALADVEELVVLGVDNGQGREVVALVAVARKASLPKPGDAPLADEDALTLQARARKSLDEACSRLPASMRPAIVRLLPTALPRTPTRKVKRREVRRLLERNLAAERAKLALSSSNPSERIEDTADQMASAAIGVVCRRSPALLKPEHSLRGDLGFDSLMLLELLVSLEGHLGRAVDSERLAQCQSVADVTQLVRETGAARAAPAASAVIEAVDKAPLKVPPLVRDAAMHWLGQAQMGFYSNVMSTDVTGQAFIPANRNTLVIANHTSHLDMGLVKYALGGYGRDMVSLAAQDYFFESGRWRRTYFENFTNLMPLSRTGSLRQSLRQAGEQLEQGQVVLLFPEGTRSVDGQLQEFKPLAAHLALNHDVDILPLWLGGAHAALPKGASSIRGRQLSVRIGPPLVIAELRRLTVGLSNIERTRAVTRLMQRAIEELSRGRHLDTAALTVHDLRGWENATAPDASLSSVFSELPARFVRGSVKAPLSYYFSLGSERWTVRVNEDSCRVQPGKTVEVADCVLKTSPSMFTRIVRDAYSPSAGEFMSGQIKSNNIQLLMTFQKVFQLLPSVRG